MEKLRLALLALFGAMLLFAFLNPSRPGRYQLGDNALVLDTKTGVLYIYDGYKRKWAVSPPPASATE